MAAKTACATCRTCQLGPVEWHVADHYASLGPPTAFRTAITDAIQATMDDERATVRELRNSYRKQLEKLDRQEERLLDLATDGELPIAKVKSRLRAVQIERTKAETGLADATEKLTVTRRRRQSRNCTMPLPLTSRIGPSTTPTGMRSPQVSRPTTHVDEAGLLADSFGVGSSGTCLVPPTGFEPALPP